MNIEAQTAVDRLYQEASDIIQKLQEAGEPSLQISASDNFRKALLLAVASNFETRISKLVIEFVRERSKSASIEGFIKNKALSRQYHTLFAWEETNANKFFSLFGPHFKSAMSKKVRESEELADSIKAFLAIGLERNRLVHLDYASFPLEKTLEEIYSLYEKALLFINQLPRDLRECDNAAQEETSARQLL